MAADQTAVVLMWRGLMIFKPLQHIPDRNQDKSFWDMIQTEEEIETLQKQNAMKMVVLHEVLTWMVISPETFYVE